MQDRITSLERHRSVLLLLWLALPVVGCGAAEQAPPSPPCEAACKDKVALRALRETIKLVYNITLQGKPVGPQDQTTPCPMGGSAHVYGEATSNPVQGATEVDLTYVLDQCGYLQKDDEPDENYEMVLTGTLVENGTLVVQPTSTSALILSSDSMTFAGTVYDPPLDFNEQACVVQAGQNGNRISGTMCGRKVGLDL
jgi:hypothetical protein